MTINRSVRQADQGAKTPHPRDDLWRLAAQATGDCLYDWDVPSDTCWCSEAYVKTFGQPTQPTTHWLLEHIHPDDRERAEATFHKVLEEGVKVLNGEYRLRTLKGDYLYVEDRAMMIHGDQGELIRAVGSVRDVTERVEARQRLEEIRQRYELATSAAGVGVWDWNVQTGEFYLDPTVKGLLGYSDEDLPNDLYLWSGMVHPDDQAEVMQAAWDHIDGKTSEYVKEHRMFHKDGTVRWILVRGQAVRDADGTVIRMTGTDTDITARKQVEQELARLNEQLEQRISQRTEALRQEIAEREQAQVRLTDSERRYRMLTANATDILILADENRELEYVSPACRRLLGFSPEEMMAEPRFQRVHPDDLPHLQEKARECDATGGPVTACYRRQHKDGHYVWMEARARVARWTEQGTPAQIVCVLRDVTDRRQAEEALRCSERRFRDALENTRHFMYRFDFVQDRYEYMSTCIEELTGFTMEEFLAKGMAEVIDEIHPDDVDYVQREVDRACREADGDRVSLTLEYRRRYKDGRYVWISDWATLLLDEQRRPHTAIGSAYDITDRKTAEMELRNTRQQQEQKIRERTAALAASEEKWRSLVAAAPDHIIVLSSDEVVEYVNRDPPDITVGEMIGRPAYDFLLPEYHDMVRQSIRDVLETGQVRKYEVLSEFSSGRRVWYACRMGPYRIHGRIVGVIAIATDVTDQKQTQSLLALRTRQLEALANNAPDPIFRVSPGLRFAFVNTRMAKLLGEQPSDLIGRRCEESGMPADACEHWRRRLAQVFETGRPEVVEVIVPVPDGERHFQSHLVPEMSDDGRTVESVLGISRDITDLKQAQKKLLDYQRQLRSLASQLAVAEERQRREIAAGLHDRIGQSLAALKLDIGLLMRSLPDELHPQTEEILEILGQIMDDTRSLTFELCPPMLYEVGLEAAIEWLAGQFAQAHGLEVEVIDDGRDKPLDEDLRGLTFQAVRELLINVTKHAEADHVRISVKREDGQICLAVSDDGVGFDVDKALAIHSSDNGGGFGLFNIRERISHFGGRMEAESEPGFGSSLHLILPIQDGGNQDNGNR